MSTQNNIRLLRQSFGITQHAVAKAIGYSGSKYFRLEHIARKVDLDDIGKIAKFLGVEVSVFFDDELTKKVINKVKEHGRPKIMSERFTFSNQKYLMII